LEGRGSISLEIERIDLAAGVYYLDVGAFEGGWSYAFDYQWHCCRIEVKGPDGHKGILMPPVKWTLNRLEEGAL
jgi:lipopolysaccharide transport system ATP-binding protein